MATTKLALRNVWICYSHVLKKRKDWHSVRRGSPPPSSLSVPALFNYTTMAFIHPSPTVTA